MADTGIFATTAEVQSMVGANASTTYNAEVHINRYMTMAESYINCVTRKNWSDAYSALNVDVKGILKLAAASYAAMMVINADLTGTARIEMETRLDVLRDIFVNCMLLLKDKDVETFMTGA